MKVVKFSMVALAALMFTAFTVQNANWSLDAAHAKVGFSVTHLLVSDVEGNFKTFTASVKSSKADFTDAAVQFEADASSISTQNDQRDGHVKSPDFLDVEKFKTISFTSTSFKQTKTKGTYTVKGNLTLHGITKPVTLTASVKTGTNPMAKKEVAGFKINGTIKRSDFGVGGTIPSAVVGDEIALTANAEFLKN